MRCQRLDVGAGVGNAPVIAAPRGQPDIGPIDGIVVPKRPPFEDLPTEPVRPADRPTESVGPVMRPVAIEKKVVGWDDPPLRTGTRRQSLMVGKAVAAALDRGVDLSELELAELQSFSDLVEQDVFEVLTLEGSVAARNHIGGTAPEQVRKAVVSARERMG